MKFKSQCRKEKYIFELIKKLKDKKLSRPNILRLMNKIAIGINQLEKINVCNLDISLDNLLAIDKIDGKLDFYLIDFDYCFSVGIQPVCPEMKEIISYIDMIESA